MGHFSMGSLMVSVGFVPLMPSGVRRTNCAQLGLQDASIQAVIVAESGCQGYCGSSERRNEPTISHEQLAAELKSDGRLWDPVEGFGRQGAREAGAIRYPPDTFCGGWPGVEPFCVVAAS
jgi:hypothetical protein